MAYSSSHHPSAGGGVRSPRNGRGSLPGHLPLDGDHQLEKLQFSLAVALTRGDLPRSAELRAQIAALGGNQEEPGT
ncbi:MAG: hypothetical protein VKI81_08920 [Synechococcaceae cyanobacterium]|nr:hypothetical protein [Synechococcaceae cyanobacterium]